MPPGQAGRGWEHWVPSPASPVGALRGKPGLNRSLIQEFGMGEGQPVGLGPLGDVSLSVGLAPWGVLLLHRRLDVGGSCLSPKMCIIALSCLRQ